MILVCVLVEQKVELMKKLKDKTSVTRGQGTSGGYISDNKSLSSSSALKEEIKDRDYKQWLDQYSNRHNKDFNGQERFNLTWVQIRNIIQEETDLAIRKTQEEISEQKDQVILRHLQEKDKLQSKISNLNDIIKTFQNKCSDFGKWKLLKVEYDKLSKIREQQKLRQEEIDADRKLISAMNEKIRELEGKVVTIHNKSYEEGVKTGAEGIKAQLKMLETREQPLLLSKGKVTKEQLKSIAEKTKSETIKKVEE